jgi:hypothetical protein
MPVHSKIRTPFWFLLLLIHFSGTAQEITYSPNRKVEKTVAQTYYDKEFLFLKNSGSKTMELNFTVIENTLDLAWSATFCNNQQC